MCMTVVYRTLAAACTQGQKYHTCNDDSSQSCAIHTISITELSYDIVQDKFSILSFVYK